MIFLGVTAFVLLSFSLNDKTNATKKVTVTGIAKNDKDAAIVVTDDGQVYYLFGVEEWEEDLYDKKVKVWGKLKLITREKTSTPTRIVAEWYGTRKCIKNPRWSLIQ